MGRLGTCTNVFSVFLLRMGSEKCSQKRQEVQGIS
uniref:Uncharacterized protein n=1 Tax=Anguilla anguilla TaxID=7936 RepID=A0A0E9PY91_ANGAN